MYIISIYYLVSEYSRTDLSSPQALEVAGHEITSTTRYINGEKPRLVQLESGTSARNVAGVARYSQCPDENFRQDGNFLPSHT